MRATRFLQVLNPRIMRRTVLTLLVLPAARDKIFCGLMAIAWDFLGISLNELFEGYVGKPKTNKNYHRLKSYS